MKSFFIICTTKEKNREEIYKKTLCPSLKFIAAETKTFAIFQHYLRCNCSKSVEKKKVRIRNKIVIIMVCT